MKKIFLLILVSILVSCSQEPQPINYSKDICDFCKMTIMDERFSCQSISTKGKLYKFDDAHCLISFLKNGGIWSNEIEGIYFADYSGNKEWIKSDKAFFLRSPELRSPMGGNIAAFSSMANRDVTGTQIKGEQLLWEDIKPR